MCKNIFFLLLLSIPSWTNAALHSTPFGLCKKTLEEVNQFVPNIAQIHSQFVEITCQNSALRFLYEIYDKVCIPTLENHSIFRLKERLIELYEGILGYQYVQDPINTFRDNIGHILFYISLKSGRSEFLVHRTISLDDYNIQAEYTVCKFVTDHYINDAIAKLTFERLLVRARKRSEGLKSNEIISTLPQDEDIKL
jgi:hypothetical protein